MNDTPEQQKGTGALVVALLIVTIILIGLGILAFQSDGLNGLKNLAIVILAVESFIATALLAAVVALLAILVRTIQQEIRPILRSVQDTANTVKGTTVFVSDAFVSPLIRFASFLSGLAGAFQSLFRRRSQRRP